MGGRLSGSCVGGVWLLGWGVLRVGGGQDGGAGE